MCNYINAGIKYVVLYMEKNGFIDNKTNVLIVLLCRSALFEIYCLSRWGKKKCVIFWLCGCSVSNLKHSFAEMLFL